MIAPGYARPEYSAPARPVPPRRLAMHRTFQWIGAAVERGAVFVILFFMSGALLPQLVGAGADAGAGNPALRKVTMVVAAISLSLCLLRWRQWWSVARRDKWTLLLVGFAMLSVLWSAMPDATLRRSLVLLAYSGMGIYLSARYTPWTLLRLITGVMGFSAVLSMVFAIAVPSLGVATGVHSGAWQGVYTQKNTLGIMMAVTTLAFGLAWGHADRKRWLFAAGGALSALLLLRSTSMTSLVVLVTAIALIPLFQLLRAGSNRAVSFLILAVLAAGLLLAGGLVHRETVLTALGRDVTLTGRTDLWESSVDAALRRPWLGYGYSAFWGGMEGPSATVWREVGWQPPNSHNGYLDLWLDLGFAGVALFAIGLLAGAVRAVRLARTHPGAASLWPMAYVSMYFIYNVTEGAILSSPHVLWVFYVAAVTAGVAQQHQVGHDGLSIGSSASPEISEDPKTSGANAAGGVYA